MLKGGEPSIVNCNHTHDILIKYIIVADQVRQRVWGARTP
jgi:hypothetical protein